MTKIPDVPSPKISPDGYSRFIVTWKVNNNEPRQFSKWLALKETSDFIDSLQRSNIILRLDGWAEAPCVLESIDEHYTGSNKNG